MARLVLEYQAILKTFFFGVVIDSKFWSQRGDWKTQITFGRGVVVTENDGGFVVASQGTMGKSTLENQHESFS